MTENTIAPETAEDRRAARYFEPLFSNGNLIDQVNVMGISTAGFLSDTDSPGETTSKREAVAQKVRRLVRMAFLYAAATVVKHVTETHPEFEMLALVDLKLRHDSSALKLDRALAKIRVFEPSLPAHPTVDQLLDRAVRAHSFALGYLQAVQDDRQATSRRGAAGARLNGAGTRERIRARALPVQHLSIWKASFVVAKHVNKSPDYVRRLMMEMFGDEWGTLPTPGESES